MPRRRIPPISPRKEPKQARSNEMVSIILEAAIQVLQKEGATRFTTARVAERAGVSVGSLYQYFPNKAAILFHLQSNEWRQTTELLRTILQNPHHRPMDRLRTLVHTFLRSECDEALVRAALQDAAPLYRDAPEARTARQAITRIFQDFLREALPDAPRAVCTTAGDLIKTTLSEVGKRFSESPHTAAEIKTYADALADMFCAYLMRLQAGS